jgi:putative hydrolase of the HAD superfamily
VPTIPAVPGRFDAVLFDFSGVLTTSAFALMAALGEADGHTREEILDLFLGPYDRDTDHPWHRVERGELAMAEYGAWLVGEAAARQITLPSRSGGVLSEMTVQQPVVDRVRSLRYEGYLTALVTNNALELRERWRALVPLDELFDTVVDSCEVGVRKPDPRIYALALERLGGVAPERAVFLDDHPGNVAGAEAAGLVGILVPEDDPAPALVELDRLLAT